MTHLDQTVLDGHKRCQACEVRGLEGFRRYRQCVKDEAHAGVHEYGVWNLMPKSAEMEQGVER